MSSAFNETYKQVPVDDSQLILHINQVGKLSRNHGKVLWEDSNIDILKLVMPTLAMGDRRRSCYKNIMSIYSK